MPPLKSLLTKKRILWSILLIAAVSAYPIYKASSKEAVSTRYTFALAEKSTVISTISGTGQVSSENTIEVKSKASGDIVALLVKNGDKVQKDDVLVEVDRTDALKSVRDANQSVRDAELSLESAQIAYEKLLEPTDHTSAVLSAQNALNQAERDLAELKEAPDALDIKKAENTVKSAEQDTRLAADGTTPLVVRNAYDKAVTNLKNLVPTLRDALEDSDDILGIDNAAANGNFKNLFAVLDQQKKIEAQNSYLLAKEAVENSEDAVDGLALRNEDPDKIDDALDTVEKSLDDVLTLLENMDAALDVSLTSSSFSQASLDTYISTIKGDTTNVTNMYTTISSQRDTFDDALDTYLRAQLSLEDARAALEKLNEGPDTDAIQSAEEKIAERTLALADAREEEGNTFEVKSALNTIAQRKASLSDARVGVGDAQKELDSYSVRAPFDGIVAEVSVQASDELSKGTTIATLITNEQIAEISLNEIDVANIEIGQKATLTFDAVEDLTITGEVAEIGATAAASQGVVNYTIKLTFDTQDERIRPGMSVSAAIVSDSRVDVVTVPNAAIKTLNGASYVQMLDENPNELSVTTDTLPRQQSVEVGLASDTVTEILSGLIEGDRVITQTTKTGGTKAAAATGATTLQGLGGAGGGNRTFTTGGGTFTGGARPF